ncbi:hypothetical protein [Planktothrix mougeotii]|uniref:HNH nuclease domain-containing protein n=1 Tax=Planktothrix mougeotii LEGE 06226 TaxID=1828728 RepID=A0ABR9U8L9_9CYAN|nr:hypothetical protein [Planktothrix mougeotii]MBE9142806.1 hypothetical protein [Planktothrix mougeotii LEGE 06226]
MNNKNLPTVRYHNLNEIADKNELEIALKVAEERLDKGHITSIVNAFFANTKIYVNGIPYIRASGLAPILRTGNSGAERPLVYQGIPGIIGGSAIIVIDGNDHISGPTLLALIATRKSFQSGKTKQYLAIAARIYEKIVENSQVRDMKDAFLQEIAQCRPYLKSERIDKYEICSCEFTGDIFTHSNQVEFAHIESVAFNPSKALDVDNGVIILKRIHNDLTRKQIHNLDGMYNYCLEKGYFTSWIGRAFQGRVLDS